MKQNKVVPATGIVNRYGVDYEFKVYTDVHDYGENTETRFYSTTETVTTKRKKYWLFGPIIEITKPKELFKISIDVRDEHYTKQYVRELVDKQIALINRKEELQNGIII